MKELETILRGHAQRYPLMEPTDAVKLIYQNEFGGGHLIRDPEAVRQFLHREYEAIAKDPAQPRLEPIGNGLVRVNLGSLNETELDALAADFIRSAAVHRGTQLRFLEKLELLRRLTAAGIFRFDSRSLSRYLEDYALAGYPIVSHSAAYRAAYRPAYRIIRGAETADSG